MSKGTSSSVEMEAAIRQRLVTGSIVPGSWLRESALAADFGVSRTPVREACNRLAREGLLRWMPQRGFQATTLDEAELEAVYPVLVALEELAVQSIVEPVDEMMAALAAIDLREAVADGDVSGLYATDYRWHRRLIESARNPVLLELHDRLTGRLSRYIYAYWHRRTDFVGSATEHDRIADALRLGDGHLAAALLRSHRLQGLARIKRFMREDERAALPDPRSGPC